MKPVIRDGDFAHRVRLRADLFYNRLSDLIVPIEINASGNGLYLNQGQVDIYGGEAGVEILATTWLRGFANFAYQEIADQTSIDLRGQRGAPRIKINAGLQGNWNNGLNAELAIHYVHSATLSSGEKLPDLRRPRSDST